MLEAKVQSIKVLILPGQQICTVPIQPVKKGFIVASYWNFNNKPMLSNLGATTEGGDFDQIILKFEKPFSWPLWKRIPRIKPAIIMSVIELVAAQ